MQATLGFAAPMSFTRANTSAPWRFPHTCKGVTFHRTLVVRAADTSTVDYSSASSVFPAEACEIVGGVACEVGMYPEAKLKPENKTPTIASEEVDREYVEYDEPKTVFPGEACDDLGGEFCEPDYQKDVYN